ncbi:hypothetical protein MD484_g1179, partial [Candolleomyces efflorescens]
MKPAGRAFTLLFDEAKPAGADIFGLKSSLNKIVKGKADSNDPFPEIETIQPLESLHSKTPSASITATSKGPGKRKADSRAFGNRKKVKVAKGGNTDEEDASDVADLKTKVKIVDRTQLKRYRAEDDVDFEFDPILDLPRETHDPNIHLDLESQAIDVNLPEKFKEVLDLKTTHWKGQPVAENKLVDSLLYGRRTTTYDSKKGEIWDVGEDEDDEEGKREDADEEWEGEPVPWEVAEF